MIKIVASIFILAFSLSFDALGVGTVYGLRQIEIPFSGKIIICFFSIFYSAIALLIGKSLAQILSPNFAEIFGVLILLVMGIWLIIQALQEKKTVETEKNCQPITETTLCRIAIKSLGISIQVIRDPISFDLDCSGIIDLRESILLGLALSFDAIGVIIGSTLIGFYHILMPLVIGIFQFIFLYVGTLIGRKFANTWKINEKLLSLLPGIFLIALALLRFL